MQISVVLVWKNYAKMTVIEIVNIAL